jgi:hypothetical protein
LQWELFWQHHDLFLWQPFRKGCSRENVAGPAV